MEKRIRIYNRLALLIIFIALPLVFYALGDFPRRSILKEAIALVTLGSFFIMLLQFYLSRLSRKILNNHKMSKLIKWHRVLGYIFISVLILHPFLIVLPRYFESGIEPGDALITLFTSIEKPGVLWGFIAWLLMIILGITAAFRSNLGISYRLWRNIHGILALIFITVASTHVISLGRHINTPMALSIILIASGAAVLLFKTYLFKQKNSSK